MKWTSALLALTAALALGGGSAGAQFLTVSSVQAAPGAVASVDINTNASVHNLAALSFTLDFVTTGPDGTPPLSVTDPSSLVAGPFLHGALAEAGITRANSVNIAIAGSQNRSGAGTVISIPFDVPSGVSNGTSYTLHLSNIQANDKNSTSVPLHGVDGALTVKSTGGNTTGNTTGDTTGGNTTGGNGTGGALITVSTASGTPGGSAAIAIAGTAALKNIASVTFTLQFDPSLKAGEADFQPGSLIKGLPIVNANTAGQLIIAAVSSQGSNGPGNIATLTFHIPASAPPGTTYPIHLTGLQMVDGNVQTINGTSTDGAVIVSASSGLPKVDGGLVTVKSATVRRGGIARVQIEVNDAIKNLAGASFQLTFAGKTPANAPDLTLLPNGAVAGSLHPKALVDVGLKSPGVASVGVVASSGADGPGTLIEIPFQVDKKTPRNTVYTLELSNLDLSINGTDLTSAANGGTLTVTGNKKGDLNGDDQVTISDVTLTLEAFLGLVKLDDDQFQAADVDGLGKLSISEVTKILKVALKLDSFGD